jgi:WD40 repeat protein
VAGTSEGRVVVWDLMTAESREMSTTSYHAVNSVQFAPDGKSVVVSFHDGRILLWNYLNNSVSSIFQMPSESWSVMIRFAPKGDEIASVCDGVYPKDWMVRLLSIFGNASPAVRDDHARGIGDIVFSPDGTMIATVSSDWTVRMWETSPARLRASLDGHEDEVTEAGFSPDGTKLASRSDDDTVRLWDAKSGECLRILSGTESHVSIKQHIPCKKPLSVTRDHREMSIWAGDISALIAYDACVYHLTDVHPHKHIYCGAHGAELEIMHLEEK